MEIQKDYISVLSDTIHSYLTGIRLYLEGYPLSGSINNDSPKVLSMMENDFKTLRAEWNTKEYLYKELWETLQALYNLLSKYDTVLPGNFQSDKIFQLCCDYLKAMEEDNNSLKILIPEPQHGTYKPIRGRGRPKATFKNKMINDANGDKLKKIHDIWGNRKGKEAALLIFFRLNNSA